MHILIIRSRIEGNLINNFRIFNQNYQEAFKLNNIRSLDK